MPSCTFAGDCVVYLKLMNGEQLVEKGKVAKLAKWLLQTEKSYDAIAPDLKKLPSKGVFRHGHPRRLRSKTLGETEA